MELLRKDLEIWLLSLQPQSNNVEEELRTLGPVAIVDKMFKEDDSNKELNSGLQFPNINKVKDFLLNSEAFETLVTAMQTWLKVDRGHSRGVKKPKPGVSGILRKLAENILVHTNTKEVTKETPADSAVFGPGEL
jgi:hypothetical protein